MDIKAVKKRARADLVVTTSRGDPDVFLWEHATRVAQCAERIADLPDVRIFSPDKAALWAAGLYHCAGWAVRWQGRELDRLEILFGPYSESMCEQGAAMLERSLADLLPQDSLARAVEAARTWIDRATPLVEAQIVASAECLQEFGVVSLWYAARRGLVDGKAVQAFLDTWHRKKEYQFWAARLNDCSRFESVREIARNRLKSLERMAAELERTQDGGDIAAPAEGGNGSQDWTDSVAPRAQQTS